VVLIFAVGSKSVINYVIKSIIMANRSQQERSTRSLNRSSSGSYLVTLPIEYIKKLKWKDRQKVIVQLSAGRIVIRDWKKQ